MSIPLKTAHQHYDADVRFYALCRDASNYGKQFPMLKQATISDILEVAQFHPNPYIRNISVSWISEKTTLPVQEVIENLDRYPHNWWEALIR